MSSRYGTRYGLSGSKDPLMTFSEMPAALRRRFVGLAAIVGVIVLANFPSTTVAACVIALLVLGVLMTLPEGQRDIRRSQHGNLETAKVAAALQKFRNEAIGKSGASEDLDGDQEEEKHTLKGQPPDTEMSEPSKTSFAGDDQLHSKHVEDKGSAASAAERANQQAAINQGNMSHDQNLLAQREGPAAPLTTVTPKLEEKDVASVSDHLPRARPVAAEDSGNSRENLNSTNATSAVQSGGGTIKEKPSGPILAGGAAVLARLRQQRAQSQAQAASQARQEVVFAYASQTGTAQEIAKSLQAESASHSVQSRVVSLNELGFENLAKMEAPVLVIIAASTGDGDAPDNAAKFYATMRRKTQERGVLKNVKFTTLGLGDSNYTRFMGVSRAIRSRMQELGAAMFYKHAEADEVDGLESVIDPWSEEIWPALKLTLSEKEKKETNANRVATESSTKANGVPALPECRIEVRWIDNATESAGNHRRNGSTEHHPNEEDLSSRPLAASICAARYLTAESSERKVIHMEIGLEGSKLSYQPGDSLAIMPENDDTLVDSLVKRLQLTPERRFEVRAKSGDGDRLLSHLGCPCTIRQALKKGCDLTSAPRKSLLRILAEYCSNGAEKEKLLHLCTKAGREDYKALLSPYAPSLLDLLQRFPSCSPPLAALLDALPPLMPRLYSISSSPLQHPHHAHIAFSVVRLGHPAPNIKGAGTAAQNGNGLGAGDATLASRLGVATGWLEQQAAPLLLGRSQKPISIPVQLKSGGSFGHPPDLQSPMLMIGPGTGVAPFRGFLQHREELLKRHTGEAGVSCLYFGCRRQNEDYLYGREFEALKGAGVLDKFEVAFSRATKEKVYVQHLMLQQAKEVADLIANQHAYIFVCGDGANMAKEVHETLLQILQRETGLSSSEAASRLAGMTKDGRYIRDIWS